MLRGTAGRRQGDTAAIVTQAKEFGLEPAVSPSALRMIVYFRLPY